MICATAEMIEVGGLEHVENVIGIDRGLEAFVFVADFREGVSSQGGNGEATDGGEVLNVASVQQPASVFAEGRVHRPMQRVLDSPGLPDPSSVQAVARDSSSAFAGRLFK